MQTTRTPRRHRFMSLAAAVVTAGAALVGGAALDAPAANAATATKVETQAGVFSTGSRGEVTEWGQWVGRDVGVTTAFLPHMTWNDISNWQWGIGLYAGGHHRMAWAVPMLPDTEGVTIQKGAAGEYNNYYKSLAQLLVKNNQADSIIRLGWEFNADSYKWSAKQDPAAWVSYWRQVVTTMRSVPGANFEFNWSPGSGNNMGKFDSERAYPGDAFVDIVGQSLYDHSRSFKAAQSVERWGNFYNQPGGLKWLAEFGKTHNKPIAFSEWGLTKSCDEWDSGDDAYFIQKFYDYVSNNNVAYESYFNKDVNDCEQHMLNTGDFPKAAALYKKLWSKGFVPSVAPVTTGTAAAADTLVRTRVDADVNSAKLDLDGAHLYGANYIDVNVPARTTRSIAFYLDKAATGTPTKSEWTAPYDFGGMSPISASALPTDVSTWTEGRHTLTVVVSRYNLPTLTKTVTFQVGGAATGEVLPDVPAPTATPTATPTVTASPRPTTTATPEPTATNVPVVTPTTTATTAPTTVASGQVKVSRKADRSAAVALDGTTQSGPVYVFVDPADVKRAVFFLDVPTTGKPTQTEGDGPFDLAGTVGGNANAFDTSKLSPGKHVLATVITARDGSTKTVQSSFTVTR